MRTSKAGLDLITHFEGIKLRPYKCPAGLWTVGIGTLIGDGKTLPKEWDRLFTVEECYTLLRQELRSKEKAVDRLITYPLTQFEYDSIVSFAYNLGSGCLQRSTLRQKLNRGDKEGAIKELLKYNKARVNGVLQVLKGLDRRRKAEALLFRRIE